MGWIKTLSDTYDACQNLIGSVDPSSFIYDNKGNKVRELRPLTPLYHCVKKCEYLLTVDTKGNFVDARILERNEAQYCIVPCTDDNESRTNSAEKMPFPLHEDICFITYKNMEKKPKCNSDHEPEERPFEGFPNVYMAQMYDWIHSDAFRTASPEAQECIPPVYEYLKKGTLIDDLAKAIPEFADGVVNKPKETLKNSVKFAVKGMKNDGPEDLSENKYAWEAWICYATSPARLDDYQRRVGQAEAAANDVEYEEPKEKKMVVHRGVCYATGAEDVPLYTKGPKSIVRQGDNAKLLPVQYGTADAPATGKYTFLSEYFRSSEQAMTVSNEAVQKSTIMLRWLCDHQGWAPVSSGGNQVLVVWDKLNPASISPATLMTTDIVKPLGTQEKAANYEPNSMVQKMIWRECNGYEVDGISELSKDIVVMMLENTSTGRCAISYYNEISADDFLQGAINWHNCAGWGIADYDTVDMMLRAPSVRDMLLAILGDGYWNSKSTVAIVPRFFEALVKCVNSIQSPVPMHCVNMAFLNLKRSMSFMANVGGNYEQARRNHRRALIATCGMIRRNLNLVGGEHMSAIIDFECTDRDYLYGRALAYFDNIEEWAQNAAAKTRGGGSSRPTNAWKLMTAYYAQPEATCMRLMKFINPYVTRLWEYPSLHKKMDDLNGIIANIGGRGGNNPLGPKGMLGYSAQQEYFRLQRISMAHKAEGDSDVDDEGNFEI